MTGPEHYLEAERLLRPRTTPSLSGREMRDVQPTTDMILMAEVHATLALAAATALAHFGEDVPAAWVEVCGVAEATDG